MIRYLDPSERLYTRKMWEEIFADDSKAFLDYYFSEKTRVNQILVVEEDRNEGYSIQAQEVSGDSNRLLSMLSLNPYKMYMVNQIVNTNYIVGVATDLDHRHQGHMKNLLIHALYDMYKNKEPFTFLMPAAEAIYKPFDFQFIYDQKACVISRESVKKVADKKSSLLCRTVEKQDIKELVEFSNQILSERYDIYTHRNQEYYEVLMKEVWSENGEILLIFNDNMLCGYCMYAIGELVEVREPVCKKGYEKEFIVSVIKTLMKYNKNIKLFGIDFLLADTLEKQDDIYDVKSTPMIMARIVNFVSFITRIKGDSGLAITLQIKDPIINENNGFFHLYTIKGNPYIQVNKTDGKADIYLNIADLTSFLFGYIGLDQLEENCLTMTDNSIFKELKKIQIPDKIFLNEIV